MFFRVKNIYSMLPLLLKLQSLCYFQVAFNKNIVKENDKSVKKNKKSKMQITITVKIQRITQEQISMDLTRC
jgi:hypothetical protein